MSDKFFVGLDIVTFSDNGEYKPVSKVTLMVDSEHSFSAGDNTGLEIVAECPYATQAMANELLNKFSGYVYHAYEAGDANIDPAAELGDGVAVNGVYGVIAGIRDDGLGYPTISAPGQAELEEEFPYTSTTQKILSQTEALKAETKVLIDRIDGITVTGPDGTTKVKGGSIETDTLYVKAANVSGTLLTEEVNLLGDLTVFDYFGQVGGHLGYTPSSLDGTAALHMAKGVAEVAASDSAAKINYNGYAQVYVGRNPANDYGVVVIESQGETVRFQHDAYGVRCLYPSNNQINLGSTFAHWGTLYAESSSITTSDRNKKHDIEALPQKYVDFILWLSPMRYKLNSGTSDRHHTGFIAQDVERGMALFGIDSLEFAGWIKGTDENGNEIYMLRYEEFIALVLAAVQRQQTTIDDHEERLKKLEAILNG